AREDPEARDRRGRQGLHAGYLPRGSEGHREGQTQGAGAQLEGLAQWPGRGADGGARWRDGGGDGDGCGRVDRLRTRYTPGTGKVPGRSASADTAAQGRARLDGLHADRRLELLHARHAPDLHPQQLIELRDLPDEHVHQVIRLSGGREALQHGRVARGRGFEFRVSRGIDADVYERMHPQAQALRIELRAVTADQSLPLELPHALPAGRLRQTHPLAELREGDTGVVFQEPDDVTVDLVHRRQAFCGKGFDQANVLPLRTKIVHYQRGCSATTID